MSARRNKDTVKRATTQIVTDSEGLQQLPASPVVEPVVEEPLKLVPGPSPKQQLVPSTASYILSGSLADVDTWQVIIYRGGKAWGRLVTPVVEILPLKLSSDPVSETTVQGVTVAYSSWQRVTSSKTIEKVERQIDIPVDTAFESASFKLKILSTGSSFALPVDFSFNGTECAAAISQHLQRLDYIRRQQDRFFSAVTSEPSSPQWLAANQKEYSIERGDSWTRYSLAFDISKAIPCLKRVAFTLAVVQQAALHEAVTLATRTDSRNSSNTQDSPAGGSESADIVWPLEQGEPGQVGKRRSRSHSHKQPTHLDQLPSDVQLPMPKDQAAAMADMHGGSEPTGRAAHHPAGGERTLASPVGWHATGSKHHQQQQVTDGSIVEESGALRPGHRRAAEDSQGPQGPTVAAGTHAGSASSVHATQSLESPRLQGAVQHSPSTAPNEDSPSHPRPQKSLYLHPHHPSHPDQMSKSTPPRTVERHSDSPRPAQLHFSPSNHSPAQPSKMTHQDSPRPATSGKPEQGDVVRLQNSSPKPAQASKDGIAKQPASSDARDPDTAKQETPKNGKTHSGQNGRVKVDVAAVEALVRGIGHSEVAAAGLLEGLVNGHVNGYIGQAAQQSGKGSAGMRQQQDAHVDLQQQQHKGQEQRQLQEQQQQRHNVERLEQGASRQSLHDQLQEEQLLQQGHREQQAQKQLQSHEEQQPLEQHAGASTGLSVQAGEAAASVDAVPRRHVPSSGTDAPIQASAAAAAVALHRAAAAAAAALGSAGSRSSSAPPHLPYATAAAAAAAAIHAGSLFVAHDEDMSPAGAVQAAGAPQVKTHHANASGRVSMDGAGMPQYHSAEANGPPARKPTVDGAADASFQRNLDAGGSSAVSSNGGIGAGGHGGMHASSGGRGWGSNANYSRGGGAWGGSTSSSSSGGPSQGGGRGQGKHAGGASSGQRDGKQFGGRGRGSGSYGGRLPSRGSSPALPSYRDAVSETSSVAGSGAATPCPAGSQEPTATTDLERFILQVTPMLSLDARKPLDQALQDLSLEDVWRFYMEPSIYGREVYALGGHRGPSICYFTPYLSAMQLFTPASPKDAGTSCMYVSDTEGWPKHMHLKFEHFEQEMPFNRTPMYEHIEQLAEASRQKQAAQPPVGAAAKAAAAAAAAGGQHAASGSPASPAGSPPAKHAPSSPSMIGNSSVAGSASSISSGSPPAVLAADSPPSASASDTGKLASTAPSTVAPGSGSPGSSPPQSLAGSMASSSVPPPRNQLHGSFLRDARVAELHPASWFAVAWYPVYRIPDAPLCARFLTFHSFAPLVISMQRAHAALEEGLHRPVAIMPLQVVGLKWYNMHGERWLEALSPSSGNGGRGFSESGGSRRQQQQQPMDAAWQAHLSELQATAERLSRGYGLRMLGQMGAEELRIRHPDYEFFNNRG